LSRQARFTQVDITRALKGALKAGIERPRVEIDRHGSLVIGAETVALPSEAEPTARNPWDDAV
jgi:hypothetical protein